MFRKMVNTYRSNYVCGLLHTTYSEEKSKLQTFVNIKEKVILVLLNKSKSFTKKIVTNQSHLPNKIVTKIVKLLFM